MAARPAPGAAAQGLLAALVALAAFPVSRCEHAAPEAGAPGCRAPCAPPGSEDSSGDCRHRVLWLSGHLFLGQTQPCIRALDQVLDECPECSGCSLAEIGCAPAMENIPAPEWAVAAEKALTTGGAGGRGGDAGKQLPAEGLNESLAQQFDKVPAVEGPAAELAAPGLQHLAAICSTLLVVGISCRACVWSNHAMRGFASSSTGASVPGVAGARRSYSYAPVPKSDHAAL